MSSLLEGLIEESTTLNAATRAQYAAAVRSFLVGAGHHPSRWNLLAVENWRQAMLNAGYCRADVGLALRGLRWVSRRWAERGGVDFAVTPLETLVMASKRLRPASKEIYVAAVRSFVDHVGLLPTSWAVAAVEQWRDDQRQRHPATTVNLGLRGLRWASRRWAEREGGVDFARGAELLAEDASQHRHSLTAAQARAVVAVCEGRRPQDIRDRAMLLLGLRTGLRRGGILSAVIEGLQGRRLHVVLKGGDPHCLDLDDEALAPLRAWIDWLASRGIVTGPIFRAVRPSVDHDFDVGAALSATRAYEIVRERAERAGLGGVHPHRLRNSFISIGLAAGVEPWRLAKMTCHRKLSTLINVYAEDLRAHEEPVGASLPSMT